MPEPRCIGFGPYDVRKADSSKHCRNVADTPAQLWCQRCEELRREHISASMAKVTRAFEEEHRGR